jgi:hypothetical protein
MAKQDWERRQEDNIAYVAYTRAKSRLVFVGQIPEVYIEGDMYVDHRDYVDSFVFATQTLAPIGEKEIACVESKVTVAVNKLFLEEEEERLYGSPRAGEKVKGVLQDLQLLNLKDARPSEVGWDVGSEEGDQQVLGFVQTPKSAEDGLDQEKWEIERLPLGDRDKEFIESSELLRDTVLNAEDCLPPIPDPPF